MKNFKSLNKLALPVIIGMFAILSSFSQQLPHEVEWPRINGSNTSVLDISKVELNDSNTVLHVNANFRPHYWIRIVSDSYLMADGKKYAMTGTEGIDADKEFWMPESGHADFKLIFEPLPFLLKNLISSRVTPKGRSNCGMSILRARRPRDILRDCRNR